MRGLPDAIPFYAARMYRRDCAALMAVSEQTKASFRHVGVPTERIAVIHNTVDFDEIQRRSAAPPSGALPHAGRPVRILVAANMLRTKGQHTAIRALRRVRDHGLDAVLWLAGGVGIGDTTGYVEWTKQLAEELGVTEHVAWLGVRNDVPQLMKAATIVALPTYTEGLPRVIVEAMALGRPVAAPLVGGIADLILPGLTGFTFEVESDAGLAECIINTSKEPDLASRVAQEAQRYIRTNPRFDPANNTKRVLEVFRCAMEGKPVADAGFNP
jgi:glycosyltransferase involved in cell wall biosynthesis